MLFRATYKLGLIFIQIFTCEVVDTSSTSLVISAIASISTPTVSIDSGSRVSRAPSNVSFIFGK